LSKNQLQTTLTQQEMSVIGCPGGVIGRPRGVIGRPEGVIGRLGV